MDYNQKLIAENNAFDAWVEKYAKDKGFNLENPTPEQEAEYHKLLHETLGLSAPQKMSAEIIDELIESPFYSTSPSDSNKSLLS